MEEVYDDLLKNAKKIDIDDLVDQLLDEHLDDEGDDDGDGDSNGLQEDENGNLVSKKKSKYSAEEKKKIPDEIKESVLQSALSAGRDEVPAGVRPLIKDCRASKMDWRELLDMSIASTVKGDFEASALPKSKATTAM